MKQIRISVYVHGITFMTFLNKEKNSNMTIFIIIVTFKNIISKGLSYMTCVTKTFNYIFNFLS